MMKPLYFSTLFILFFSSCIPGELKSTYSDLFINKGELIAVSVNGRDVISYDYITGLTKQLTTLSRSTDRARGVAWLAATSELAVSVDGRDRIIAVSAIDGSTRDLVVDSQFNGTPRGLTQLENGDIVAIESNNLERFTESGNRITTGWPIAINAPYQVRTLSTGNILVCAGGSTDQVRIYDEDGNLLHSDSGPGGHDARGCTEMQDGKIAVSWNGGNDQVWLYDSNLVSGSVIVTNADIGNIMTVPAGAATSINDTILISDLSLNHILEFSKSGTLIRTFGVFNNSTDILVIP